MNTKQLYIILGAILLLLLAEFGYMALGNKQKDIATNQRVSQNTISNNSNVQPLRPATNTTPSTSTKSLPNKQPLTTTTKIDTSNWQSYKNSKYGFELKVPKNSTVEPAIQSDSNTEYIRIQNYSDNEDIGLRSGDYYLEIYIGDTERQCQEDLERSHKVTINGTVGYRGLGLPGGDAGGQRFAFCMNRGEKSFFILATEDSETGNIANAILDSFNFTK